jgi:hypothetical protein
LCATKPDISFVTDTGRFIPLTWEAASSIFKAKQNHRMK